MTLHVEYCTATICTAPTLEESRKISFSTSTQSGRPSNRKVLNTNFYIFSKCPQRPEFQRTLPIATLNRPTHPKPFKHGSFNLHTKESSLFYLQSNPPAIDAPTRGCLAFQHERSASVQGAFLCLDSPSTLKSLISSRNFLIREFLEEIQSNVVNCVDVLF
jgi:hypothetical protein